MVEQNSLVTVSVFCLDTENKLFAKMTNLIDEFGTKMIRI